MRERQPRHPGRGPHASAGAATACPAPPDASSRFISAPFVILHCSWGGGPGFGVSEESLLLSREGQQLTRSSKLVHEAPNVTAPFYGWGE